MSDKNDKKKAWESNSLPSVYTNFSVDLKCSASDLKSFAVDLKYLARGRLEFSSIYVRCLASDLKTFVVDLKC